MKRGGFTLIELLAAVAIVVLLAGVTTAAMAKVKQSGELARELGAARNVISAYLAAAAENDGQLPGGYVSNPGPVFDDQGKPVAYPASGRYPWRVAKYLSGPVKGALLVNQQARLTEKRSHDFYVYLTSFAPSLGMNTTFVGGNYRSSLSPDGAAARIYGNFCVRRLAEAVRPATLLVFCSARFNGDPTEPYHGHHQVDPPYLTTRKWLAAYREDAPAEHFGYVHPRYGGRAVCAMLDGHVELLTIAQLEDMRRWSNQAAEADNPRFVLTRP
jgi:prepilin-type N-terminal cleavage/methylation domain-containing protein/prepilin-type processing-associated H-X9-DG protein